MGSFTDKLNDLEATIKVLRSETESGQRSPEWFAQRLGKFTGSKISDLMKCGRSTAKKEWDAPEKIFDLGAGALSYIYAKAKERQRNKVIESATTAAMRYGIENETTLKGLYMSENNDLRFEEVGFLEFIEGIAGASGDGKIFSDKEIYGVELKCATTWEQFYNRTEVEMNPSHMDFWQLQSEMLAMNVGKIIYIVAEPSESIFEPNITDYSKKIVYASELHQAAIIKRCEFGDKIIKEYLKGKNIFSKCVEIASLT